MLEKKQNSNSGNKLQNKLNNNISILNKFLPSSMREQELWKWWNSLPYEWKAIFVENYLSQKNLLHHQKLKNLDNTQAYTISNLYFEKTEIKDFCRNISIRTVEKIKNLDIINLKYHFFENYSFLFDLKELKYLRLKISQKMNISFFSNLKNLKMISIHSFNTISELDLSPLINLNTLIIRGSLKSTLLKNICNLKKLKYLYLYTSKLKGIDINAFQSLMYLNSDYLLFDRKLRRKHYPNLKFLILSQSHFYNEKLVKDFLFYNPSCKIHVIT